MSSLEVALRKAKKIVAAKEKASSIHTNQLFVVTEYSKPLTGELVVILDTTPNE